MHEIATAAGCSRATLYRYFENREALYTAYVHRETLPALPRDDRAASRRRRSARAADRGHRRVAAQWSAKVPALASWFATAQRPIGGEMAEQSEVIKALTEAFLISLGPTTPTSSNAGPAGWCG